MLLGMRHMSQVMRMVAELYSLECWRSLRFSQLLSIHVYGKIIDFESELNLSPLMRCCSEEFKKQDNWNETSFESIVRPNHEICAN